MNAIFLVVIASVVTSGWNYGARASSGVSVTLMPSMEVCEEMIKDIKNNLPRVGEFQGADPHEVAVYCKVVKYGDSETR